MWYCAPVKDVANLQKQGLSSQRYHMPRMLFFNNKDPDSKFLNKKVREAVEYALDKPAIAKALGFGYYLPHPGLCRPATGDTTPISRAGSTTRQRRSSFWRRQATLTGSR